MQSINIHSGKALKVLEFIKKYLFKKYPKTKAINRRSQGLTYSVYSFSLWIFSEIV
jgi:hypothetical protein